MSKPTARELFVDASTIHLTPEDLAARLKVHAGTPANWRHKGRGPEFLTLSHGTVRYTLAAVLAWEASRTTKPVKPPPAE